MKLNEITTSPTMLTVKQVQKLMLLIAKHARMKKSEKLTGFKST